MNSRSALFALACAASAACVMPQPIPDGDRAMAAGDYATARDHYDTATERFLTPTEHKHVARRLLEATALEYAADFEKLKRESPNMSAIERALAFGALWRDVRSAAMGRSSLSGEIALEIDLALAPEIEKVDALMAELRIAEALEHAQTFGPALVAESASRDAIADRLQLAVDFFRSRAEAAKGPRERAVFEILAAFYGDRADQTAARAALDDARAFPVEITLTGAAATGCPVVPSAQAEPVLQVAADVSTCTTTVSEREARERYTWVTRELVTKTRQQCEYVQVGTQRVAGPVQRSCSWSAGAAGVLSFYTCSSTQSVREVAITEYRCKDVEYQVMEDVVHSGERDVSYRETLLTFDATFRATLPTGESTDGNFATKATGTEAQWETPQGSQSFDGKGLERASQTVQEKLAADVSATLAPRYYESKARALVSAASGPPDPEAHATAALLGFGDPGWLAEHGATQATLDRAAGGTAFELGSAEPKSLPRTVDLSRVDAFKLFGVDARAGRGFSGTKFEVGARYRAVSDIPTQTDRVGFTIGLGQNIALLSLAQRNAWGFGFEDELSYFLDFGARVSEPHVYRGFGGHEDQTDGWGSGGAGVAYALGVGWRTNHFGLRAGARLHASTFRIGDLVAAETGMPLTAQIEFRGNERYPVLIEGWGLSPFGDRGLLGAKLSLPIGGAMYFVTALELAEPTINVSGLNEDDRVRVGRHPTQLATIMLSAQL